MFYSHEILTSTQYGVSTIWLVATIGPRSTTSRKITRKAIQGVNIPRACDTIIQPGAPIALRLQGSLLYGVSRVYAQQCIYMLTDVEKVQSHMQTFFRVWGTSTVDPQAGKAKRDQLIISDDPFFELNFQLPTFSLDDDGNVLVAEMNNRSNTQKTSSQMSPFDLDLTSGSHGSAFSGLRISASSPAGGFRANLHQMEMPFGRESMGSQKPGDVGLGNFGVEEDPLVMDDDWGIRIDDQGNIIQQDEPDLPDLPQLHSDPTGPGLQQSAPAPAGPATQLGADPDEMIIDMPDDILPEAEAFPQRRSDEEFHAESSSSAAAPLRRQRKRAVIRPDNVTMLTTDQHRAFAREYTARTEEARKVHHPVTQAQARQNAYNLTFGYGIGHVGAPTPIPGLIHPLAELFAGPALERSILGFTLSQPNQVDVPHGHRRTSAEAFGPDPDARRVRPRLEDSTPQAGRAAAAQSPQQDAQLQDDPILFDPGEEDQLELGREAPRSALSQHSAPWNRAPGSVPGSSHRGSSIKATGTGRQVSASPLQGRGSGLAPIDRLSSNNNMPFGSDPPLARSSSPIRGGDEEGSPLSQALDQEGQNFLEFVDTKAREGGEERDDGRSWVEFGELFEQQDRTKVLVTQGFFHVLTLATRNLVRVEQEDPMEVPFGKIRLCVV